MNEYVELRVASAFSFLEAASDPETLVDRAAALGYRALALVDRDGVYGAPRFHKAARAAGIKGIIGAELTIRGDGCQFPVPGFPVPRQPGIEPAPGVGAGPAPGTGNWEPGTEVAAGVRMPASQYVWRLPVLVESQEGYRHLCRLVTAMKLAAPKGEGALALEALEGHTRGLIALAGRPLLAAGRHGVGGLLDRLVGLFGRANVYVELQRHFLRDEERDSQALAALAAAFRVPIVATNGVRFSTPGDRPLYDVLTCIRHRTDLVRAGRRLAVNAERYLKPPADMARLFQDVPEAVAATAELADRLAFTMADLGYRFPEYPVPPGESMNTFLRRIARAGALDRYRPCHERARRQIERELDLIEKLDLAGYFLIVWDLVNFCRRQGILVQGRGSAANSAVCYSLGITAVDPVGMDLLFERFLSEERGEWPDIDLDLPSGERRERVIQYVYERYGRLGAAMTANVITYRDRSAAREVGKALGIAPDLIDRLARVMHGFEWVDPEQTLARDLRDAGADPGDPAIRQFADLWRRIRHLPRHLGQHSGGMVIGRGRLDEIVPLEPATMPGRVVIQWDKDDCADMGIVKIDLLGLGMMAVLQDAITMVNDQGLGAQRPAPGACLDLAHLPPDDPDVYRLLQEADTVGVFQVESRAQMATLPRLKPRCFYDLVVEVAIIRPGPIVGQMVHPYLRRRSGREPVTYPHPALEPILARTLGVPLFQEQLLRMAMTAAGFSGGAAEELRRAFGFKRSVERMAGIEERLRRGMAERGLTGEAAGSIIRSITSFALYGFPESHAASFALLVYASAYLKVHYPAAFYAALLNNQPMGFYHPATLVKDAQRRGVRFAPVDVQCSDWPCTVEKDGRVRLGLQLVTGLRAEAGRAIVAAGRRRPDDRTGPGDGNGTAGAETCPKCGCDDPSMIECVTTGEGSRAFCSVCAHDWAAAVRRPQPGAGDREPARFVSLDDLVTRTGLRRDELATLAEIGALHAFGLDRRDALWQIERAARPSGPLLGTGNWEPGTRDPSPLPPMTPADRLMADYEGTGLTIGPHPMAFCRRQLALRGVLRARDLPGARRGRRVRVAGAVITRQRPGTAGGFMFLTLEDETGLVNIIVRPDLFAAERLTIVEAPFLVVDGTLQVQDDAISIKADRVRPLAADGPAAGSRDFC